MSQITCFSPRQKGALGEILVSEALDRLPAGYFSFHNLVVPANRFTGQTTQIDHVVTCSAGIFVIETKKYSGAVSGRPGDRFWFEILNGRNFRFRNPLNQNDYHVSVLARYLSLPSGHFHSVVVFIGHTQFFTPRPPANVISTIAPGAPGLRRYIEQFTEPHLPAKELSETVSRLAALKNTGLPLDHHVSGIRERDLRRRLQNVLRSSEKGRWPNLSRFLDATKKDETQKQAGPETCTNQNII